MDRRHHRKTAEQTDGRPSGTDAASVAAQVALCEGDDEGEEEKVFISPPLRNKKKQKVDDADWSHYGKQK